MLLEGYLVSWTKVRVKIELSAAKARVWLEDYEAYQHMSERCWDFSCRKSEY